MCDNREPVILGIKTDGLKLLINLYFGETKITVPILIDDLHPCKTITIDKDMIKN